MLKLFVVYRLLSLIELGPSVFLVLFLSGEFSGAVRSTVVVLSGATILAFFVVGSVVAVVVVSSALIPKRWLGLMPNLVRASVSSASVQSSVWAKNHCQR